MTSNIEAWDRISARSPLPAPETLTAIRFGHDVTDADLRILGDTLGKRVLVLGSEAAAVVLAKRGATVIAVQPSAGRIAHGRRLAEREEVRLEWHRSDLADLAFLRADSIDLVFSTSVLDEVEDITRVLRQVHRVLRPGAAFVFAYEHPMSWATRATADGTSDVAQPGGGEAPMVRRPYGDDSPVTIEVDGEQLTVWPRTISRVFTELGRASFRVDVLAEPASPGSPVARLVVWRARKEGV